MGGKRHKHRPKYKPRDSKPKTNRIDPPAQPPEPEFSEPPLIVFISSLIDKMRNEREAVNRAVRSIPITRPWQFENTPASSQPVDESYLSKVRTCDIFVLVLGSDYSKPVAREYEAAVEARRPILAFINSKEKEGEQDKLITSIKSKRASYTGAAHLQRLVAGSIWDELIRAHRSAIHPNAASQVISQVPLPSPELEDLIGYFVVGLDNVVLQNFYRRLGATNAPSDLQELYPNLDPLSIVNVVEVNIAVKAIQDANRRSITAPNRRKAFVRELQREAIEIASHHLKRQRTQTPEPEVGIPGITYYLWGMEHNFARLVRLLRLEETLREPIKIERTSAEVMFKDVDHFLKLTTIIQEAAQKSSSDIDEFDRLISVEAAVLALEDSQEE